MKIGILTYFGAHNYGAFLQAYALREVIRDHTDNDVEIINFRTLKEVQAYSKKKIPLFHLRQYIKMLPEIFYYRQQYDTFEKNIRKYLTLSGEQLASDSIEEFADFVNNKYNLIIVGSDEVWKTDGFRLFPDAYWLPNVQSRKAAFAVSSRNTIDTLTDRKKSLITEYLKSFDYIGTRDRATYDLVTELSQGSDKCRMNCDPTFLYDFPTDRENGKRILRKKFRVNSSKKIIGLILSDNKYGKRISESLNKDFEIVSLSSCIAGAKNYAGLTPFEWIDVISACDMIITSRFHGVVFSIKNNRPFLAVEMDGDEKKTSKVFDLLERNDLLQCYIEKGESIPQVLSYQIPEFIKSAGQNNYTIDYRKVTESEKIMGEDKRFFASL